MVKPIRDWVLVEAQEEKKTTSSGIIMPGDDGSDLKKGIVVATGEGYSNKGILIPLSVKEGDTIFYKRFGVSEIKEGDKNYLLMKEENIVAKL